MGTTVIVMGTTKIVRGTTTKYYTSSYIWLLHSLHWLDTVLNAGKVIMRQY